ncbi:MAG: Rap1a/Tai family immunity protein [Alphaproteobacteria bacterium]
MTRAILAILLTGFVVCLLAPHRAHAAYMTTADLQRDCLSGKKEKISGCLNYIAGIIDYHILMQSLGTNPTIDFCLPANLSLEDAGVAVMMYLRSHPQHDAFIASAAVPLALNQAYPCRPPPPKKVSTKRRKR